MVFAVGDLAGDLPELGGDGALGCVDALEAVEDLVMLSAARGAEHHQILDSFEGVNAAESTVATQLGQITGQVADSKHEAGYAATAARLRVAASVFGA